MEAVSGENRTRAGSLKMAAASPRHSSTSSPCQVPRLSGAAMPATPVLMPQTSWPRARIASRVGPACAAPAVPSVAARAVAKAQILMSFIPTR
jgi:hypothetical protein